MDDIRNEAQKGTILLSSIEKLLTKLPIPAVGTVTLLEKNQGSNEEVEKYLRGRVAKIVAANPWLTSNLNKTSKNDIIAQYSTKEPLSDCFSIGASRPLSITKGGYKKFVTAFQDCMVPSSNATVGKPVPVFKVTLVPGEGKDSNSLAIVVSLSHILGDGHTFYQLHNMLSQTAKIQSLNPVRPDNLEEALRSAMAPGEYDLITNPGITGIVGLLCKLFLGSPLPVCAFEVDTDVVKAKKEAYKAGRGTESSPPFISTNDILTSWVMNSTKCDMGDIVVNMRSRLTGLPNVGENMAGNITLCLGYRPQDYRTPELIRRSVTEKAGVYHRAGNGRRPGFWTKLKCKKTIVSNWAGFAEDLDFQGCTQVVHFPLVESWKIGRINQAVLFRPRKGITAVLTTIPPEELEKDELMAQRIF